MGEFVDLLNHKQLADMVKLEIHGDGVLAHILKTGAEMAPAEPTKET